MTRTQVAKHGNGPCGRPTPSKDGRRLSSPPATNTGFGQSLRLRTHQTLGILRRLRDKMQPQLQGRLLLGSAKALPQALPPVLRRAHVCTPAVCQARRVMGKGQLRCSLVLYQVLRCNLANEPKLRGCNAGLHGTLEHKENIL